MTPLSTRGGSGGVHANVDDMRHTADRLAHAESTFVRVGGRALSHTTAGALLRTAPLSPGSAVHVEVTLAQAAASTGVLVIGVEAQVLLLRARADLFVLADEGAAKIGHVGQIILTPFVLGAAIATGALGFTAALIGEVEQVAVGVIKGEIPLSDIDDRLRGVPGAALQDTKEAALKVLSAFPEVTDVVTGGLPWLIHDVIPLVPGNLEGVIGVLQAGVGLGGLVQDRPVHVVKATDSSRCTEGLRGIMGGVTDLERRYGADEPHYRSGVRITKLAGTPPHWVVEIPGTTDWDPAAGGDPSDLTSNVQLMQRRGELLAAIREAMHQAGIAPGDPVLVAGHSQGGIAAAALAGDPATRRDYHITNVLTAGSPIAGMPIPNDVHVLAIEHTQDPVPRLEGHANPDRANWTTVTLDVSDQPGVSSNPFASHSGGLYTDTAGMIDRDPALALDRASFDAFTHGDGVSTDYELRREPRV